MVEAHYTGKGRTMSPLALEMLIWFCTRAAEAGPFPSLITHEPQKEIRNAFLADGIIEPWDKDSTIPVYRATEKGRAWLSIILNTPLPIQVWTDPRDGKPIGDWI